jgi:hypothetical protein
LQRLSNDSKDCSTRTAGESAAARWECRCGRLRGDAGRKRQG